MQTSSASSEVRWRGRDQGTRFPLPLPTPPLSKASGCLSPLLSSPRRRPLCGQSWPRPIRWRAGRAAPPCSHSWLHPGRPSPHIASVALLSLPARGLPACRGLPAATPHRSSPAFPDLRPLLTFLEVRSHLTSPRPSRPSPLCWAFGWLWAGPGCLCSPPLTILLLQPHSGWSWKTQGPWLSLCSCVRCLTPA